MASSLVSVIVPVYKDEQFLENCLESIVKQTYENLEVLCVNFGASEKCADILSDYAHKYKNIQVFTLKEGGKATAKNLGLKKAKGDLVFFLDADDKIDKICIEELVKTQTRTNADVVCVHDIVICEGKKKTAKDRMISGHSEGTFQITNEIVNQMWVVAWGKLFKIKPIRVWSFLFLRVVCMKMSSFTMLYYRIYGKLPLVMAEPCFIASMKIRSLLAKNSKAEKIIC